MMVERLHAVFEKNANRLGAEEPDRPGLTQSHAQCNVSGHVQHAGDKEG